jgi:hypothetical protein
VFLAWSVNEDVLVCTRAESIAISYVCKATGCNVPTTVIVLFAEMVKDDDRELSVVS